MNRERWGEGKKKKKKGYGSVAFTRRLLAVIASAALDVRDALNDSLTSTLHICHVIIRRRRGRRRKKREGADEEE